MTRLLVYTENYLFGGANRYMIDMTNAIGEFFDNIVIASNPSGVFPDDLSRLRFPYIIETVAIFTKNLIYHYYLQYLVTPLRMILWVAMLPLEPIIFLYNLAVCSLLLIKIKPSLVLCCNGGYPGSRSTLIMLIAARVFAIPAALSVVSTPHPPKKLFRFYSKITDRIIYSSTRVIIVNAETSANALREIRNFPNEKIVVVHNGLEDRNHINKYDTIPSPDNPVLIGCISRIEYAKGVTYLFDAYARLCRNTKKSKLILAGYGDVYTILSSKIDELGLRDCVVLMGHVDAKTVDELLDTFHIYVLPSLHEGFPYSILEAMRAGCAIIATEVGGIPEAIFNGEDGLLVEARSSEALYDALKKLLSDRILCARLGINARKRFLKDFQLQNMHKQLKKVFVSAGLVA